jgi:hypothetical protein
MRNIPITREVKRPIPKKKKKSAQSHWEPKSVTSKTLKNKGDIPEPELFTKVVNGETKYYRKRYIPKKKERTAPKKIRRPVPEVKPQTKPETPRAPEPEPEPVEMELPSMKDVG